MSNVLTESLKELSTSLELSVADSRSKQGQKNMKGIGAVIFNTVGTLGASIALTIALMPVFAPEAYPREFPKLNLLPDQLYTLVSLAVIIGVCCQLFAINDARNGVSLRVLLGRIFHHLLPKRKEREKKITQILSEGIEVSKNKIYLEKQNGIKGQDMKELMNKEFGNGSLDLKDKGPLP